MKSIFQSYVVCRFCVGLFFLFFVGSSVYGQAYFTAAGLRLGTEWGLTLQHRLTKKWTAEAILQSGFVRQDVLFTVLAERHFPLVTRNFNIYGGGGLHWAWLEDGSGLRRSGAGVSFIGGIELSLGRMNISYDIKPAFTFSGYRPLLIHTGLSFRYILIKGKVFKKQQRKKRKKQKSGEWSWPWER